MDYNSADKEIAKELTLQILQNPGNVLVVEQKGDPEAVGKAVASLYNTLLENISH